MMTNDHEDKFIFAEANQNIKKSQNLAEQMNTSRSVVSRVLKKLEHEGVRKKIMTFHH